jgi:hypothetical protein
MMDEATFWNIIDTSRQKAREIPLQSGQDFIDIHEQTLAEILRTLPPAEIASFRDRFWSLHRHAYRWDLWAAAYWLCAGCSDDGFTDFRSCLISLGKDLYYRILADPDTLADIVDLPDTPYMQAEGFQYIASRVYEEVTGEEIPEEEWPESEGDYNAPHEPAGERIDHDDDEVMRRHFPKLVAKYPDMGD